MGYLVSSFGCFVLNILLVISLFFYIELRVSMAESAYHGSAALCLSVVAIRIRLKGLCVVTFCSCLCHELYFGH